VIARLTERQEKILATVVETYIASARPLSSAAIVELSHLPVSSATVRNELATLEEMGFVMQLHTSGGRIPSTAGYKYYIEHLLPKSVISNEDQVTIRHQFHQAHSEVEEWFRLAAAVLAHRAHNVALVTAPRGEQPRFKHVELVEAQPHTVLTIVVLSDGTVIQEAIATEQQLSQEILRTMADELNRSLQGSSSDVEIQERSQRVSAAVQPFAAEVQRLVRRSTSGPRHLYHEGLAEMLTHPEFTSGSYPNLGTADRIRQVIDFLQQGIAMEDLLGMMAREAGVHVVIGGEAPLVQLEDFSMVIGRYGPDNESSGMLGLLGPTRMDYGRAISLVRYMSELMTDLVFIR
jgi:heat-inducible transcriptional repressor